MQSIITSLSCMLCIGLVACVGDGVLEKDAATREGRVTALFTNIDLRPLQTLAHAHFDDVTMQGLQYNTKPGTAGGYMTMTPPGRKLQRFLVEGGITNGEVTTLLSKLQIELTALIEANGATITGGVGEPIKNRPIAFLSVVMPGSDLDLVYFQGFYLEYADAGGEGAIDVMATRTKPEGDDESWYLGLVIHEPKDAK